MKYLKYLLAAVTAILFAAACNHDPDPIVISSNDPRIEPHAPVVVNNVTVNENFTLVWSAAKFGMATTVNYQVKASVPGFSYTFDPTTDCYLTLTNKALFDLMGITRMGDYPITFSVTAQSAGGEERASQPQVVDFNYTKITYLWIPNGPNFNFTSGRVLQAEDDHFYGFVYLATGEFKFTSQPNWDGTCYGPGAESGMLTDDKSAPNIQIVPGHYYMDVDLSTMTYTAVKITSAGLYGDVNLNNKEVPLFFDAANNIWQAVSRVTAGQEYVVRFNGTDVITEGGKEYRISLGGDPEALTPGSDQKLVVAGDGITGFNLSIGDYPYTIEEGQVDDDLTKLYVARKNGANWNYAGVNYLPALLGADGKPNGQYSGLIDIAASTEVLFAHMQSEFGTRYGGAFAALVKYAGGEAATGISLAAGQYLLFVDLNEGVMKAAPVVVNNLTLVGDFNGNNVTDATAAFTFETASRTWKQQVNIADKGYMQVVVNKSLTATVDGMTFATALGGKAAGLYPGGNKFYMPAGVHDYVVDYSKSLVTFSTDGSVRDFSPLPDALGITGDFSGYSWNASASPTLWGDGARGEYWGYMAMFNASGTSNFKFTYDNPTNWVAGELKAGTEYEFALRQGDNMQLPDGVYRWDVNLNTNTAKAKKLNVVGLIGSGVGSWDVDVEMVYDPADHLFKARVTALDGEFKVRFDSNWDHNLGGDVDNLTIGGANIPITAGTYDIVLDLVHTPFKITVTPVE